MNKKSESGRFWPYMILGFLFIGITLGYWTIKNTISLPVHESNEFMQKYQDADKGANAIEEAQARFDSKYKVTFSGLEKSDFKPKHLKRKAHIHYTLNESNSVAYAIATKDGTIVKDANLTLLLTRPQTEKDDRYIKDISFLDGKYVAKGIDIIKPGRYILRAKITIGNDVKYLDIYGFKR